MLRHPFRALRPYLGCLSERVKPNADHLAAAVLMHRVGDHERLGAHLAGLPDLLGLGVQPEVGVAALQGALPEEVDLLVERLAQAADRRAAHALDAEPVSYTHLTLPTK